MVQSLLVYYPGLFAIDMIWLGYVARNFYKEQLHSLLSPEVNWPDAFLFYFIYIVGILIFAVRPGLEAGSLAKARLFGALFGFFTYATYDLTNLATLRDWPVLVTVVDIALGTVLCSSGERWQFSHWLLAPEGMKALVPKMISE